MSEEQKNLMQKLGFSGNYNNPDAGPFKKQPTPEQRKILESRREYNFEICWRKVMHHYAEYKEGPG